MARKKTNERSGRPAPFTTAETASDIEIAKTPGPGPWLLARFAPISLFSLKASFATSGVGRTLAVPTPYAVKMALLDAGLTTGLLGAENADSFVRGLRLADVRIGPPERAVATHTIVKIRQEPKTKVQGVAYTASVAYREFLHYHGELAFAFDLNTLDRDTAERIGSIAPAIRYIGKRGGFIQFVGLERRMELGAAFTVPLRSWEMASAGCHIEWLDDFGPEATFEVLDSYSVNAIKRDKHRKFVQTAVPLSRRSTGPGFTEYAAGYSRR